jgi:23S rRNA (uridine2552-2'-O)-methyltransferase
VITLVADVTQNDVIERIQSLSHLAFDVVVADLSPNVSGIWELDHARQIELARTALRIFSAVGRQSGNMLVKVFQGAELKDFEKEMKSCFGIFRIVKPPASRPESAELYLLGLSFTPGEGFEN